MSLRMSNITDIRFSTDILGILPNVSDPCMQWSETRLNFLPFQVIIVTLCTTFFTNSRLRMRARRAAEAAAVAEKQVKDA
jgi:hypothetical protein